MTRGKQGQPAPGLSVQTGANRRAAEGSHQGFRVGIPLYGHNGQPQGGHDQAHPLARRRYAPVLDFFNASHKRASWKMLQINFTVGVRGSISTADILERVGQWTHSFVSSLERLGVSRKSDIERTRKAVAKRTFDAHDLMLRSYFAVKFSPSGQVDFAKIRTNSVALQHRIRPRSKTTR